MFNNTIVKKFEKWTDNQGYTLIEVMIAMVILLVGMLSVAAMQTKSTNSNTSANRSTRGFAWCSDRMERLKSLPYIEPLSGDLALGDHVPTQDADGIDNDYDGQIDETGETGSVSLSWTISNGAVANTMGIAVTATWQTPLGGQKTLTLTSVRARNLSY
ncbi:MAG: prepilin-type N-terminal cleavage/methylation domain-containing protein [Desulfobacterales bacterium]|jgi:prepilin-type N-terminal cleavage/methylation domain-containing protein